MKRFLLAASIAMGLATPACADVLDECRTIASKSKLDDVKLVIGGTLKQTRLAVEDDHSLALYKVSKTGMTSKTLLVEHGQANCSAITPILVAIATQGFADSNTAKAGLQSIQTKDHALGSCHH